MLGSGCVCGDERQVDLGLHGGGQFDLGLLGGLSDPDPCGIVLVEVHAGLVLELLDDVVGEGLVHVGSSELGVSGGRKDLEDSVVEVHDGHIEGSSSEVEDEDLLGLSGLVETVCEGCCGRLVDDTDHIETCDLTGVLGGLPLVVVEVCGDGDDRLVDGLSDEGLCVLLDLHQDVCGDLLRGVLFPERGDLLVGTHFPLDVLDGPVGVGDGLSPGGLSDEELSVFSECHVGREGLPSYTGTLCAGDDGRPASLHDGGGRVAGSKIDSDYS